MEDLRLYSPKATQYNAISAREMDTAESSHPVKFGSSKDIDASQLLDGGEDLCW
jgi:hypothetical protein